MRHGLDGARPAGKPGRLLVEVRKMSISTETTLTPPALRIGIDIAQLFHTSRTGIYHYCAGLVGGLKRLKSQHAISLFHGFPANRHRHRELAAALSPIKVRLFRHPGWPYRLRLAINATSRVDAFYYISTHCVPVRGNRVNAFLIPDLTPVRFPQWHTASNQNYWCSQFELIK